MNTTLEIVLASVPSILSALALLASTLGARRRVRPSATRRPPGSKRPGSKRSTSKRPKPTAPSSATSTARRSPSKRSTSKRSRG